MRTAALDMPETPLVSGDWLAAPGGDFSRESRSPGLSLTSKGLTRTITQSTQPKNGNTDTDKTTIVIE
ncbi:hypothetical protein ACU6TU_11160 [Halomonas sp. LS-001]